MAGARVLVVDDNQLNLDLARYVLEADGFVVEEALDVEAAWMRLRAGRPDVVLVDIQLPGSDGLSLVRAIRATPGLSELPLIAFTAYAMPGDEQRFLAAGCDGYLAKPVDVYSFAAQVRAYLRGSAAGPRAGWRDN